MSITRTTGTGDLGTTITHTGNLYDITGGTRPGGGPNLFHSFGDFSVGQGDIANFLNTPVTVNGPLPFTSNILGRVTGGHISSIYGTIQTTGFGDANLFLMNPSGFVLGPSASLDIGGAVSFTTAQYIRLFDGAASAHFYANPANDTPATNSILTINPLAFTFLNASPAAYGFLTAPDPSATITVQGSSLSVPSGQSISLVGGKVVIEGGATLTAPSGKIHLATTASPGEFDLNTLQSIPNVDGTSFTTMGTVEIREGSVLKVSGRLDEFGAPIGTGASGTVYIRSGQLVMDAATIQANTVGSADGVSTAVELHVLQDAVLSNSASISTQTSGAGRGGDVQITAGTMTLDGSTITTETVGDGNGGNVTVNVGTLSLTNSAVLNSNNFSFGIGQAGNITVQGLQGSGSAAIAINLDALSSIKSETQFGLGHGGNIQLTADKITLNSASEIRTSTFFGGGIGGDINLDVRTLVLNGGSKIQTSDFTFGTDLDGDGALDIPSTGAGGHVIIQGIHGAGTATESMELLGGSQIISESVDGPGGRVSIKTSALNLAEASRITSSTFGYGRGGEIVLSVQDATLSGGSYIASVPTFFNPVAAGEPGNITIQGLDGNGNKADSLIITGFRSGILQDTYGTAGAGDINIHTNILSLANGAVIEGGTIQGEGTGGRVTIDANSVTIASGAHISSQARFQDAGQVAITANELILRNGSIETSTSSELGHRGGDVVLNIGTASLTNGATITSSAANTGIAGNIDILASGSVTMTSDSSITASSTGSGNAGNIRITSGSTFLMQNSSVTTEASHASGGQITINAPDMIRLIDSTVSTSVAGAANDSNGGNISIDPDFVILKGSQILAQAFAGTGGAIDITAGLFLADSSSIVDASSTQGISGTVQINAPINNLSSVVGRLPESLVEVQTLLRAACAARMAQGGTSSFVERGRDSIPAGPEGLLASPYLPVASKGLARTQAHPSIGISGLQLRRLPIKEPPAPAILSEHAACSS
ncbi:MAG: filamentous hemagglutinin N-terminal domain-containing protein [Nitrospira sp.]|nr:filamentous hemagglutinin N-terminal domain-containing protein [Nitrospira sp.]